MPELTPQRSTFRQLHESGCFVIPNPWDFGSAKYLAHLGFPALATSSAGYGFTQGLPDSVTALPRDGVVRHVADIVAATDLPINADFQSGYGATADAVEESVRLCVATGVAGLSIEDATGDPDRPLYDIAEAVERLQAARQAIGDSGVMLMARAECYLVGHPQPFEESLRRLAAYSAAGADVLFAPGARTREHISAIVQAVAPKPVNVIVTTSDGLTVGALAELGVRRISVGSSLARAAWTGFMRAAQEIKSKGTFTAFEDLVTLNELKQLFGNR